ncbi:carboxypeptidase-like regulatory domain-containing protein [Antarcticibacterium sp. 1MA-6-2]|uniref:carboxypeptidase-like regulatory domain-containing protein n=1 Tax=Antarcticibacterium sp. 1MA-6-2 TaxID=2908210 RepID=UPI001F35C78E|nr:carboxypeptidase-like regulatory domain-containing protein [Antarcticibacterium sp. 1MA-6-2]UJH90738.1 carboxypeptidase-like regulatory domain-containing protein [Antarcticibacterium sp. 1MA-6-2]
MKKLLHAFLKKSLFLVPVFMCFLGTQQSFSQDQIEVTGNVTGEDDLPLPGVTVMVKGTTNGVVTDFDGNYSINAPDNSTLVFTYVGFASREVAVDGVPCN